MRPPIVDVIDSDYTERETKLLLGMVFSEIESVKKITDDNIGFIIEIKNEMISEVKRIEKLIQDYKDAE